MEKSLDESRGNEERGRAQGTEEGERARCRPVEGPFIPGQSQRGPESLGLSWEAPSGTAPLTPPGHSYPLFLPCEYFLGAVGGDASSLSCCPCALLLLNVT